MYNLSKPENAILFELTNQYFSNLLSMNTYELSFFEVQHFNK